MFLFFYYFGAIGSSIAAVIARRPSFSILVGVGTTVHLTFIAATSDGVVSSLHVLECCSGLVALGGGVASLTCVTRITAESVSPTVEETTLIGVSCGLAISVVVVGRRRIGKKRLNLVGDRSSDLRTIGVVGESL